LGKKDRCKKREFSKKKVPLGVLGIEMLLKSHSLGFRAAANTLNHFAPEMGYPVGVTISFQTLINQLCRVGLGLIHSQQPIRQRWACVVDFTMNQGPVRLLPLLCIPFANINGRKALTLQDVICVGVYPMIGTKGEAILPIYEELFERLGAPTIFLQDEGGNLSSAGRLFNAARRKKNLKRVPIVNDIGHMSALIAKRMFERKNSSSSPKKFNSIQLKSSNDTLLLFARSKNEDSWPIYGVHEKRDKMARLFTHVFFKFSHYILISGQTALRILV
jgi:hypothetical protein